MIILQNILGKKKAISDSEDDSPVKKKKTVGISSEEIDSDVPAPKKKAPAKKAAPTKKAAPAKKAAAPKKKKMESGSDDDFNSGSDGDVAPISLASRAKSGRGGGGATKKKYNFSSTDESD